MKSNLLTLILADIKKVIENQMWQTSANKLGQHNRPPEDYAGEISLPCVY